MYGLSNYIKSSLYNIIVVVWINHKIMKNTILINNISVLITNIWNKSVFIQHDVKIY